MRGVRRMPGVTAPDAVGPDRRGPGCAARPPRTLAFGSIVHVNEKGGCFGGTEEYIALLASELAGRGVRSHLVCGLVTGVLPADLSSVHIVEGLASRRPRPGTGEAAGGCGRGARSRCHLSAQRVRPGRGLGPGRVGESRAADLVCARPLPDVPQRAPLASRCGELPAATRERVSGRHRRRALRAALPRPFPRRQRAR